MGKLYKRFALTLLILFASSFFVPAWAGTLVFDGVPVDISTSDNENLVIVPGTGGHTQIGDAVTGADTNATTNDDLYVTGVLEVDGAAYLDGGIVSGSGIIPSLDATHNLGSSSKYWNNLYATNIFVGDLPKIKSVSYSWPSVQGAVTTVLMNDGAGNLSWTLVSTNAGKISTLLNADAANTLANSAYAQMWNWSLGATGNTGMTFGETAAATSGGTILKASTLSTSTATPFVVTNLGVGESFRVNDETGDADATPFVIDASGNVGIGTATPSAKLDVNGAGNIEGTLSVRQSAGVLGLSVGGASGADAMAVVPFAAGSGAVVQATDAAGSQFAPMTVRGTTVAAVATTGSVSLSPSATTPLVIGGTTATSPLTLRSTSGTGAAGADLIFQVGDNGSTEAMRILNSGNTGIGNADPGTKLDLSGALTVREISAPSVSPTDQGRIYFDATANKFKISEHGGAYVNLVEGAASSVPFSKFTAATETNAINNAAFAQEWQWNSLAAGNGLKLSSSAAFTGALLDLTDSNNTALNTGVVGKLTVSGALSAAVPLMITNLGTGPSFQVNDETGDADTTPFVIDAAGKVGIGTTAPADLLHVAGSATFGLDEPDLTANTVGALKLISAGDNAFYTTFTAGTQTANADYTLPTSSSDGVLTNTAGSLSWTSFTASETDPVVRSKIGMIKSDGNTISAATEGTDYYKPGGTDVRVVDGGTGASDAPSARFNLGLEIDVDVQRHDSDLDAFSAKAAPAGVVVGTTDTQVLTNKTLVDATSAFVDETNPAGILKLELSGLTATKTLTVPDANGTLAVSATAPITLSSAGAIGASDFVGSGVSHARGIVPDPGVTAGTTKYLREDAQWMAVPVVTIKGAPAADVNFVDTTATATVPAATWALDTATPKNMTLAVGPASGTEAGVLTTGAQTLSGAKTFSSQLTASSGVSVGDGQSYAGAGAVGVSSGVGNVTLQAAGAGTTGNIVIGAANGGAGSATPDLLVLDKASGASPAGANGALVVDSTGKINIFENGAWKVLCNKSDAACGAGSGAALSAILNATDANATANGDNAQAWNWSLTSAAKSAFAFGESAAAINGIGNQYILEAGTALGSTAGPLKITSNSTDAGDVVFDLAGAGDFNIQDNGANFASFNDNGTILFKSSVDSADAFQVQPNGSTTPVLGVDTLNSRVGIGTAAPADLLHVAGSATLGVDKPALTANTAGSLKLISAGDTAFSTIFTAGTQTADASYTLPLSSASGVLTNDGAGTLSWVQTVVSESDPVVKAINGIVKSNGTTISAATVDTDYLNPASLSTSLKLYNLLSDKTGSGSAVFGTSPTFTTSITDPLVIGGTGTTSTLALRSTSGAGAAGADIIFQTGNNGATETMRILNSGSVGIGTTSPTTALEVNGVITTAGISSHYLTGTLNVNGQLITNVQNLYGWSSGLTIYGSQTASTNLTIDSTNQATKGNIILAPSGGNVGIGTTSPIDKLEVAGGIHTSGATAVSKPSEIWMDYCPGCAGAYTQGRIGVMGSTSTTYNNFSFEFYHSDGSGMFVPLYLGTNGNIGIGTTSPGYKLDVNGTMNATTIYEGGAALSALYAPLSSAGNYVLLQSGTPGTTQTGNLNLSGAGLFGGNVRVGSGTPIANLDVAGAGATAIVHDNTGYSGKVYLRLGTHPAVSPSFFGSYLMYDGTKDALNVGMHSFADTDAANDANVLTILRGSHSMGLDTELPLTDVGSASGDYAGGTLGFHMRGANSAAIVVEGSSGLARIHWADDNGGLDKRNFVADLDGGKLNFQSLKDDLTVSKADMLVLDGATGNVGIGTAVPPYRFTVSSATAKATPGTINVASFGSSDTTGISDLLLAVRQGGSATQSSRYMGIQSYESGYGAQPLVLQELSGNVGIGSTSPTTALDVNGVITATGGSSTQWNTASADAYKWDGGTGGGVLVAATGRTSLGLVPGVDVQAWDADLNTYATKAPPAGAVVGTTDTQVLSNKSFSDNVGIGTTTPLAKLGFDPTTTAAGGINFGDSTANLYRSAVGTIKTDGSIFINGGYLYMGDSSHNGTIQNTYAGDGPSLTVRATQLIATANNSAAVAYAGSYRIYANTVSDGAGIMSLTSNNTGYFNVTQPYGSDVAVTHYGAYGGNTAGFVAHETNGWVLNNNAGGAGWRAAMYAYTNTDASYTGSSSHLVGYFQSMVGNAGSFPLMVGLMPQFVGNAAGTVTEYSGISVASSANTGGASLASFYGLRVQSQTVGTNIYGLSSEIAAATGRWNIYAGGTAANYFAGNVGIGTASPDQTLQLNYGNLSFGRRGQSAKTIYVGMTENNGVFYNADGSGTTGMIINQTAGGDTSLQFKTGHYGVNEKIALTVDRDGNVGIGTTSPAELLDVAGRVRLAQTTAPGTTTDKLYNVGGALYWNGTNVSAGASQWTTTGANISNSNTGNVGIGTTGPNHKLDVTGDVNSSLYYMVGGYYIVGNNGVATSLRAYNTGGIYFENAAAAAKMILTDAGNVGIGTTNPGANLDIFSSTAAVSSKLRSSFNNAIFDISRADASSIGYIRYMTGASGIWYTGLMNGDSKYHIYDNVAATDRITVLTTGEVGIGTTTPQAPLHVAGTSAIFGAGEAATPTDTTIRGAAAGGINIPGANLTFDASNGTGLGGSGALIFRTAPTSFAGATADTFKDAMRITNTGNIIFGAGEGGTPTATTVRGPAGAGTDIPGANLTFDASNGTGTGGSGALVFRTAPAGSTGAVANTLAEAMRFGSDRAMQLAQITAPGTTTDKLYNVGGALYWNGTNVSAGASQWTTTGANISNSNTGNVGIGTTTPVSLLSLKSTSDSVAGGFSLTSRINADVIASIYETSGRVGTLDLGNGGTVTTHLAGYGVSYLAVEPGGGVYFKVGIGLSPVNAKLEVLTNGAWEAKAFEMYGQSNTRPTLIVKDFGAATGNVAADASSIMSLGDNSSVNPVSLITTGNVGIGTASISSNTLLDVNGNLKATRIGVGTNPDNAYSVYTTGTIRGPTLQGDSIQTTTSGGTGLVRLYLNSQVGQTADLMQWGVNGGVLGVIQSSGNVGIGTTGPTSTLHVNGSVTLSITSKTTTYTVTASDYTILCNATTAAFTVTLPTAVGVAGRTYVIKKTDSSPNKVTLAANGAQSIDGASTRDIFHQNNSFTVQSDGTNWVIV